MESLWGEEFTIKETKKQVKKVLNKLSNPNKLDKNSTAKQITKSKKLTIQEKIPIIAEKVYSTLGDYKEETILIQTREELHNYIDKAIQNNIIAIDTETNNSLDPLTCLLMGACIYTPTQKQAYIPLHHINPDTNELLPNQLTEQDIAEEFERLSDTRIIMHNGKFDYQVIKCTVGVPLAIYWDTMIAAKILDENEFSAGLKQQYVSKIDPSIEKYSIEGLFEGLPYAIFPPELFALYAATDAYMTYKLYEWQVNQFEKPANKQILKLFFDIEMPIVIVTAEMELTGVEIDKEYAARLSMKYHKQLEAVDEKINAELSTLEPKINAWKSTPDAQLNISKNPNTIKTKAMQLSDPISLNSPTQLAILLYDILKVPVKDKKAPRGTGEPILKQLDLPICSLILEKRGLEKLIGTYIDKLPAEVNQKTNRLHAKFNQLGAQTGRLSSSNPNLQNIPSSNKAIRMMFKATDGYKMVGADFSL